MSLHKAIKYGKEHRKEYVGKDYCKSVDPTCRNHGSCTWCKEGRLHKFKKDKLIGSEEKEINNESK